jgi:hypothetical protein
VRHGPQHPPGSLASDPPGPLTRAGFFFSKVSRSTPWPHAAEKFTPRVGENRIPFFAVVAVSKLCRTAPPRFSDVVRAVPPTMADGGGDGYSLGGPRLAAARGSLSMMPTQHGRRSFRTRLVPHCIDAAAVGRHSEHTVAPANLSSRRSSALPSFDEVVSLAARTSRRGAPSHANLWQMGAQEDCYPPPDLAPGMGSPSVLATCCSATHVSLRL